ncbi:hypothetical protein [Hanstruepera marina]|uniref:hypothetical protein n=1 Tax=Hanstruepera marina TaxID=2873265 RepID=UPI001CA73813|nr:hypothetical protein [Hanstruepera marina]
MKILNILFFHVYNAYYKDGNYSNDIPHLTAYGIVACSLSMLFTSILLFTFALLDVKLAKISVIILFVGFLLLLFYYFFYEKKYATIYNLIKDSKWDNFRFKIASWLIVILGFVSVVVYSYLFNR